MYDKLAPCLGCGITGEEKPRPSKDELCWDCREAIKIGVDIIKNQKRDAGKFTSIQISPYYMQFLEGKRPKNQKRLEQFPHISDENHWGKNKGVMAGSSKDVSNKFQAMLMELNAGKRPTNNNYRMDDAHHDQIYYIPANLADKLADFINALSVYCNIIADEEFARGKQLLVNLNEGSLTLKELEARK